MERKCTKKEDIKERFKKHIRVFLAISQKV